MRCPECGYERDMCPDHQGMCYACCATGKAQMRAMGMPPEAIAALACKCEDREELRGIDLLEVAQ